MEREKQFSSKIISGIIAITASCSELSSIHLPSYALLKLKFLHCHRANEFIVYVCNFVLILTAKRQICILFPVPTLCITNIYSKSFKLSAKKIVLTKILRFFLQEPLMEKFRSKFSGKVLRITWVLFIFEYISGKNSSTYTVVNLLKKISQFRNKIFDLKIFQ